MGWELWMCRPLVPFETTGLERTCEQIPCRGMTTKTLRMYKFYHYISLLIFRLKKVIQGRFTQITTFGHKGNSKCFIKALKDIKITDLSILKTKGKYKNLNKEGKLELKH